MDEFLTPRNVLLLSALLFSIGVYGVLARRNLLITLMSLETMLVGANIALIGFSRMFAGQHYPEYSQFLDAHSGQFFTLMVMTVAAGEVGVGLAIVVTLYRTRQSIDVDGANELRL